MKITKKGIRIFIWLFFVVISLFMISPNFNPKGIVITSISDNSPIDGLSEGDIIYKMNDRYISVEDLDKTYVGLIKFETSVGNKFATIDGSLGITGNKPPSSNLKFGIDIEGGIRALVKIEDPEFLDQSIATLETRTNVYGLVESSFRPLTFDGDSFIEISMSGGDKNELKELLERQGKFEATIPITLPVVDDKIELKLKNNYIIDVDKNFITLDGGNYFVNNSFSLEEIEFVVDSLGLNVNLISKVYDGNDIINVYTDPQRSTSSCVGDSCRWTFGLQISNGGAQKFASITKNVQRNLNSLESPINLYLDGELIDSLSISSSLRGQVVTEISINGGADTADEAKKEQLQLQSILRSGSLPTTIEIVSLDSLSPTLGSSFLSTSLIAGLYAIFVITLIIFIRYRNILITLAVTLVSLSEILIILGMSVIIGWTIDLAAIAGIIAAVGTGVDSQIIILDQAMKGRAETLKENMRRAFFIIFGAGGVIIAAMLPLMILGFGLLKGFAITTIVGVLAGILITRPAFGVIIEKILNKKDDDEE